MLYISSKPCFCSYPKKTELFLISNFFTMNCNWWCFSFLLQWSLSSCLQFSTWVKKFESKSLRKLSKSLLPDSEYTYKLKDPTSESLRILDQHVIRDDQTRWEHIKFEIRQFSVTFSKNFPKSFSMQKENFLKRSSRLSKNLVHFSLVILL